MVWILGSGKVLLMATYAFRRSIGIIPGGMTLATVLYVVPLGEWEKVVVDTPGIPPKSKGVMTFGTLSRKTGHLMVGALGGGIIILVAANAVIAQPCKAQVTFVCVAFHTT